jgi:hypothetical protein
MPISIGFENFEFALIQLEFTSMSDSVPVLYALRAAEASSVSSIDPTIYSDASVEETAEIEL